MPRTRIVRALCHPLRATVQKHIRNDGPVALTDLAAVFDLASPLIRYHVRVLVACGQAKFNSEGRVCAP